MDVKSELEYVGFWLRMGATMIDAFLWMLVDRRKQGLHDKLAGTVVVRPRNRDVAVSFGT